jgi:DNA-binding NarL/FixJ family response regulator
MQLRLMMSIQEQAAAALEPHQPYRLSAGMAGFGAPRLVHHAGHGLRGQMATQLAMVVNPPAGWEVVTELASPMGRNFEMLSVRVRHADDLARAIAAHRPRLILLDADAAVAGEWRQVLQVAAKGPACDWLLALGRPDSHWTQAMIDLMASGCVLWDCPLDELARAFDSVVSGELWYSRRMFRRIFDRLTNRSETLGEVRDLPSAPPSSPLSARESEVLACLRMGMSNKEIAERLAISVSTVKKHVARTFEKRGLRNRRQGLA